LVVISSLFILALSSGCVSTIHKAAYEGDTKTVLAALKAGEDINAIGAYDFDSWNNKTRVPVFGAAVIGGQEETVRTLLEAGLSVNQKINGGAYSGMGLVTLACIGNQPRMLEFLLEKGASPNIRDKDGWTALHCSALHGHHHMAGRLLKSGADPNANNSNWGTPLHVAVEKGHGKIVQLLLAHGAYAGMAGYRGLRRVSADYPGMTPLKMAEKKGFTTIVQMLRQVEAKELGLDQSPAATPQVAGVPTVSAPVPAAPTITSDVDRVPAAKAAMKKHAYAVVIGIEQYREKLPKADFADRDAKLVGEYLTKVLGYPEENVIVRTNDRATRTDLVKYFEEWLRSNVERDGSVFVYYSGHGAPNTKTGEAYFVPYDGDPSFVESTAYPVKQLYAALDKLPARDITVVLDSCFSGAGGRSVLARGARPMGLSIENATLASGKTVVLAASGGDQISNSFEEKGHGLLTYYFLKGLQGEGDGNKDGAIELAELFEYVKPNVQRIARKQYNNEQTPQLLASPELLKRGGGRLLESTKP
jgi:ankyrin repeat protein